MTNVSNLKSLGDIGNAILRREFGIHFTASVVVAEVDDVSYRLYVDHLRLSRIVFGLLIVVTDRSSVTKVYGDSGDSPGAIASSPVWCAVVAKNGYNNNTTGNRWSSHLWLSSCKQLFEKQ